MAPPSGGDLANLNCHAAIDDDLEELEPFGIPNIDWNYDRTVSAPRSGIASTFQCCTNRRTHESLKKNASDRPVWETSNLGWWDFQRRKWDTVCVMNAVYSRHTQCQTKAEELGIGHEQDQLWHECFALTAKEIRQHAEKTKGYFIKAGQIMSTMVGVLPDEVTSELVALTDKLPASTVDEVFRTIQRDFHLPPADVFSHFGHAPVASASIAQVHKAKLRATGELVAVKVQHEGVDTLLMEDVDTLATVADSVVYWSPDLDFRDIVEETRKVLPQELDFREERRALERAGNALRKEGNPSIVPKPHTTLFGPHVFVMEYVDAVPITNVADTAFCKTHSVDKIKVVSSLVDAFGIMAFKDGLFHADPHPGNIRLVLDDSVEGGARPVLFDWGLFKEFEDTERLVSAKVFHCLGNFDVAGVFEALDSLGVAFKKEASNHDMRREIFERARSVMKDTVSRATVRANVQLDIAEHGERVRKAKADGRTSVASYSPLWFLADLPNCIFAFLRMMQMLRGLCVTLEAEGLPILHLLTSRAREALQEASLRQDLAKSMTLFAGHKEVGRTLSFDLDVDYVADSSLEAKVRQRLHDLLLLEKVVGAQVAVVVGNRLVCDLAVGDLSTTDARPVHRSTRFPLLGASSSLGVLALLRALRRIASDVNNPYGINCMRQVLWTPIARFWPKFAGGHSQLALKDLFSHSAGLQYAFPSDFSAGHLDDLQGMAKHLEETTLEGPWSPRYAYLMQSFAVTKLASVLCNQDSLLHLLRVELSSLGLDVSAAGGGPEAASICRDLPALSRVSMAEVDASRARRQDRDILANRPDVASLLEAIVHDPMGFDPLQGNAGRGDDFRGGLSLGASARSLAVMMSNLMKLSDLADLQAFERAGNDPTALGWALSGGATTWTVGGLQSLTLRPTSRWGCWPSRSSQGCGVVCGFGPVVAHFPDAAPDGLTVAVTVNDVLHGRTAATELVREAVAAFGFKPGWSRMQSHVVADGLRLVGSGELDPLTSSIGGLHKFLPALDSKLVSMATMASEKKRLAQKCGECCAPFATNSEPYRFPSLSRDWGQ